MMHQRPAQVEANARTWYKWKAEEKPSCRHEQQNQEIRWSKEVEDEHRHLKGELGLLVL